MADKTPARNLSNTDAQTILGFPDIDYQEPYQLDPGLPIVIEPEKTPTSVQKLTEVKDQADRVLGLIGRLKSEVDSRCKNFSVVGNEKKGSRLYQAMVRVFGERTTTVTYNHYVRALEIRQKLAEEDAAKVRAR